jgi:hypothetical protein
MVGEVALPGSSMVSLVFGIDRVRAEKGRNLKLEDFLLLLFCLILEREV